MSTLSLADSLPEKSIGAALAPLDATRLSWSRLEYSATKFFLSVRTAAEIVPRHSQQLRTELIAPTRGDPKFPVGPEAYELTLATNGVGTDALIRVWFDDYGSVLQRSSLYSGKKQWYRVYRYTSDGAYSLKKRPRENERGSTHEGWTDTTEDFYPYTQPRDGLLITEGEVIFYLLAMAPLRDVGDTFEFLVFSTHGLDLARLTVREVTTFPIDVVEQSAQGEQALDTDVDALLLTLHAQPYNYSSDANQFEFLGLRGDIDIMLDAVTHIPLRVTGQVDYLGEVNINLRRIVKK